MAAETTTKLSQHEPQSLTDTESRPRVAPPVDVYENEEEILLYADMPGVDGSALDLSFDRGQLTIYARRDAENGGRELRTEYQASDYYRRFAVPPGVDAGKIHAELKNGVLHLHLPKSDALKPRQIPVQAG